MKKIKYFFLLIIAIICCNCRQLTSLSSKQESQNSVYNIRKIDSINNYYIIYAKNNGIWYKIVSKKENMKCQKIAVGKDYKLSLKSIWNEPLIISGIDVSPSQTPHVTCLGYPAETIICIERDSINDLHHPENLKGLCIVE